MEKCKGCGAWTSRVMFGESVCDGCLRMWKRAAAMSLNRITRARWKRS